MTSRERNAMARLVLRCRALEKKNAELGAELERLRSQEPKRRAGGNLMYRTEAARQAARRKSWREAQRRRKLKAAA